MRALLLLLLLLLPGLALPGLARAQSLGMNLNGISDWSAEQPFLDAMRSARPWIGHAADAWGAWDAAELAAAGAVGPDGWPLRLPEGVTRLETFVLTDQPEAGAWLAGRWVLRWEGTAVVELGGRAADVRRVSLHEMRFSFAPGEGPVGIAVSRLDPADPLRAMTLVREDRLPLFEAGALFEPRFLDRVRGFRAFRFMDWMATNGSDQVAWEDRPRLTDFTWAARGVPAEVIVRLANEAGADPWVTLPHRADDGYVRAFAALLRDGLDPRLVVHAEWSNEVWNWIFPQAAWARDQAVARWGEGVPEDAWMQYAGLRAAEVADLWAEAFAGAPRRLVRVVGVQTGWPGLEEPLLEAPLAVAEGRRAPWESFDAYAVTGYLGYGLGAEDGGLPEALAAGAAPALAERRMREDLADLAGRLWPHHAAAAARRGLRLVAYEAGPHAAAQGALVEDAAVTDFLSEWSYSPAWAAIQGEMLAAWRAAGGTLLMPFVDVAKPSRWGSWGALRHLDDANPRWDGLLAANAEAPWWDGGRDPAAFADGRLVEGTAGPDALSGTPEEDVVLAGAGDDAVTVEGADTVDGGEGRDAALLPGALGDWTAAREGATTLLARGWQVVRLTRVEEARFAAGGTLEIAP